MERCLSLTTPGMSVTELCGLARHATAELGYRTAWLSEVAGPDAFVLASAVASRVPDLDLGVAVVPAYTRTPPVLAMAAGSVSQALDGRTFRLGIGSSSEAIVAGWNGLELARPLTRVRETVEATRAALAGERDYEGSTVSMRRFRLASPPDGPVELYVGALGPRMLGVAGAVGDGVCLNMMPPRVVPAQLEAVRAGAEQAGRRLPDGFGVMARLQVVVTDDPGPVRQMLREAFLAGYLAQPVYNNFLRWMGYEEEAAAIAAGWEARDRDAVHRAIHDRLIDDLTAIGPAGAVAERLEEYGEAGVTQAALSVLAPDGDTVVDTLTELAPGR